MTYYDYWRRTPLINKPWFINPGLTLHSVPFLSFEAYEWLWSTRNSCSVPGWSNFNPWMIFFPIPKFAYPRYSKIIHASSRFQGIPAGCPADRMRYAVKVFKTPRDRPASPEVARECDVGTLIHQTPHPCALVQGHTWHGWSLFPRYI